MLNMEDLFIRMLEAAKKDKKVLAYIKKAAVRGQQFELASNLHEIDKELFPESEEAKEAKKINIMLRMIGVNASDHTCWVLGEAFKVYLKKKGEFSLIDASIITDKGKTLFPDSLNENE